MSQGSGSLSSGSTEQDGTELEKCSKETEANFRQEDSGRGEMWLNWCTKDERHCSTDS